MHVGVVEGRSHCVLLRPSCFCSLPPARVHVQINFLRWNRSWLRLELVDLLFMLARTILVTGLVKLASMTHKLQAVEMGAWTGICHVSWWFGETGARGCGTESIYFGAERIAHHIFHCSNNFDLIRSVCTRTWVLVSVSWISIFHRIKRCHTARIKI